MFCEKYYKKLLNYAKKDQIWADPNCPYRGSLCSTPVAQHLRPYYTTQHERPDRRQLSPSRQLPSARYLKQQKKADRRQKGEE